MLQPIRLTNILTHDDSRTAALFAINGLTLERVCTPQTAKIWSHMFTHRMNE